MANITLVNLRERLQSGSPETLTESIIDDDDPWIVREKDDSYEELRSLLRSSLGDQDATCLIVGSAKYGFSIAPDSFGRDFRQASDIDIAVISAKIFDDVWSALLQWRYPWHTRKWTAIEQSWAIGHMEEHMVGSCSPDQIRVVMQGAARIPPPIQPISSRWFSTFKDAGNLKALAGHEVSGRLYRTTMHLKKYTTGGLASVKRKIEQGIL